MCNKLNLIFYYVSTLGVLLNFDLARWRFHLKQQMKMIVVHYRSASMKLAVKRHFL